MTTIPIAGRTPRLLASRPVAIPTPSQSVRRHNPTSGNVHRTLAEAPVGGYPMLEAALAWQCLRRAKQGSTDEEVCAAVPIRRNLPIVETHSEAVAARLTRLLSGLAWAIITPGDSADAGPGRPPAVRVEVPRPLYHRVGRALTNAWRDARRQFDPRISHPVADAEAAIALWRMGILVAGPGSSHNLIHLQTSTALVAEMLAAAARRLDLNPIVNHASNHSVVALWQPSEVHWLLTKAGAGETPIARTHANRPVGAVR